MKIKLHNSMSRIFAKRGNLFGKTSLTWTNDYIGFTLHLSYPTHNTYKHSQLHLSLDIGKKELIHVGQYYGD